MRAERASGVQPKVLRWARELAGLSVPDVAKKLKNSVEEVEAWETVPGEAAPSYTQLETLAHDIYRRPLAIFFLPEPPAEIPPRTEFRTLPDNDMDSLAPSTRFLIRQAHAYQISLEELFHGKNPAERLIWRDLRLSLKASLARQASHIREFLQINVETQVAWRDDDEALKIWRRNIEAVGVFVFKNTFKQSEISGFCLQAPEFPIIMINNSTTKTRQIFSLIHELAHLLIHVNGLSKFDHNYIALLPNHEKQIEQFCNAIAAEVLMPSDDCQRQTQDWPQNIERVQEDQIAKVAERYHVSREVVLRRFFNDNRVGRLYYETKAREWEAQRRPSGSGNYYATQGVYLSERFMKEVFTRHYRRQLSLEDAADLLGIKPKSVPQLEERILQGGAA
jgi:Zn-dependent peptidase ImmA (M78 family)